MSKVIFEIIAEYDDEAWEQASGKAPNPEMYVQVIENDIKAGRIHAADVAEYLYGITQDAESWGVPASFRYHARSEQ